MPEIQPASDYFRFCPGEEQIKLSNAVCRGRRAVNFPKCPGCQFNDDERAKTRPTTGQDRANAVSLIESLFRPHDILGLYPSPLSTDAAWRIGHAAGQYLHGRLRGFDRANPSIRSMVVGNDGRRNGEALEAALIEGVQSTGIDVVRIGVVDTPQLYFAVNHFGTCGGIQITGGRHPLPYSGMKICAAKAFPIASETGLASIRDLAVRVPRHRTGTTGSVTQADVGDAYREFVRRFLVHNAPVKPGPTDGRATGGRSSAALSRPLQLVVSACGGVAAQVFPLIFDGIDGLTWHAMQFDRADADSAELDPALPVNATALRKAVQTHKADFGVGFDGDADRVLFVDDKGTLVRSDLIATLLARRFIEREPGAAVVYDHRFSSSVTEEIQRAGGLPIRERVGHVFIKKTMSERHAVFGADLSGRFYFRDNSSCENAMIAVVHLINLLGETGRKLSELVRPISRYRASGDLRFTCPDSERVFNEIAAAHGEAEIEHLDGVTIRYPDWWFNLRRGDSSSELQLTLEARTRKIVDARLSELGDILGAKLS